MFAEDVVVDTCHRGKGEDKRGHGFCTTGREASAMEIMLQPPEVCPEDKRTW